MTTLKLASTIEHLTPKLPTKNQVLKSRTYAFILDLYSIVFLNKIMSLTWLAFINKFIGNIALSNKSKSIELFSQLSYLTLPIITVAYFFFFYYLNSGQSLGKILFKLKVCAKNDRNRDLTFKESFARAMGYLFTNYLWYIPFVLVYLRSDGKGIHDYISQTYVLREDEMAILDSLEDRPANDQIDLFPQDPVSTRISKLS